MIEKVKWLIDRWRIMQHPWEEWYRIRQQVQYQIIDRIWYKRNPAKGNFLFNTIASHKYSVKSLKEIIDLTRHNYFELRLLNVILPNIISYNQWNRDVKNDIDCQPAFVHKIDDFDYSQGEIKYIYELSRLYQLPQLAVYAVTHEDAVMINTLKSQIRDWKEQNPFLGSIAWKSGNEVGIRVVNLILFRQIMNLDNRNRIPDFDPFLNELIELHFRFLITHLSLFSSKGNHYIGEIAGIIAICSTHSFTNSERYLKKYFEELQREIIRLIHEDGFNREQATRYQASYINLFLTAIFFAKEKGYILSKEANLRLCSMYHFLEKLRISSKRFFLIGDNDDAQLIYPYADLEYDIYESMLNDGALLYNGKIHSEYHFDLRNYLLLGEEFYKKYAVQEKYAEAMTPCIELCKSSGYFILKNDQVQLLFDVGNIGLKPSMCHGHSDILSFSLYYKGHPVLVDAGSYQYNQRYKKYRDYFHAVHSHNTIAVNGDDQAVLGSGMFWLSDPAVEIKDYSLDPLNPFCMASHNGYVRNTYKVEHTRKVEYHKERGVIFITDFLQSMDKNRISFYLHFHPDIEVRQREDDLIISNEDMRITLSNPWFHAGCLSKGDKDIPLGWYSASYDKIEPTYTFKFEREVEGNIEIYTEIKL